MCGLSRSCIRDQTGKLVGTSWERQRYSLGISVPTSLPRMRRIILAIAVLTACTPRGPSPAATPTITTGVIPGPPATLDPGGPVPSATLRIIGSNDFHGAL